MSRRIRGAAGALMLLAGLSGPASAAGGAAGAAEIDSLLLAAREASGRDRHDEAIAIYEHLLLAAPWRTEEISAPLAYQYAWTGRLPEARAEFRRATALAPDDHDLRLGELLVLNWMGRHLEAWKGYDGLHARDVTRPEALVGLATAQRWAGRDDLALRSLDRALILDPDRRDAVQLQASLRASLRPAAAVFHDRSEDSDGYRVNGVWTEASFAPHPQCRLVPWVNRVAIRSDAGPDLDETWLGLRVVTRPWTRLSFWGQGSWLTERESGATWTPVVGTLAAEWTAHDALRVSGVVDRFAVVSSVARPEKITGEVAGVVVDARPFWLTRMRASVDRAGYSDDNTRWTASLAVSRELGGPARIRAGGVGRFIDFARWIPNGIWTPDRFWSAAGTVDAEVGTRDRWSIRAALEAGPAREGDADIVLNAGWSISGYGAVGPLLLEGAAGHTEGNLETGTGYDRTWTRLGARLRF